MRDTKYVYECACGQLTAVDLAGDRPRCMRCRAQTFTFVLRYQPLDSRSKSSWFKTRLQTHDEAGNFNLELESNAMSSDDLIDQNSRLSLSRARAMLDHLDMLRQSKAIGDDLLEEEVRRVMKRVMRMVRNAIPKNKA